MSVRASVCVNGKFLISQISRYAEKSKSARRHTYMLFSAHVHGPDLRPDEVELPVLLQLPWHFFCSFITAAVAYAAATIRGQVVAPAVTPPLEGAASCPPIGRGLANLTLPTARGCACCSQYGFDDPSRNCQYCCAFSGIDLAQARACPECNLGGEFVC